MYEQSIPATAYMFIGITSLVVTYSHIMQNQPEPETEPVEISPVVENVEPTPEPEPAVETPTVSTDSNESQNTTQQNEAIPVAEAVPVDTTIQTQEPLKKIDNQSVGIGGKRKKTNLRKTKSVHQAKKKHKKNKTKRGK